MVVPLSRKKNTWPKQEALVVSENENLHMMIRELIRAYSWRISVSTNSVQEVIDTVRTGTATLVIIDDTQELPALRTLRTLMTDTMGLLTPVLAMMVETSKNELAPIKLMGRPEIIEKPLTPSKFIPAFVNLVRTWEKSPFADLRGAGLDFLDGNSIQGVKSLAALLENKEVYTFAAQAIALKYRAAGKLKEAESLLLTTLKRNPRNISIIFSLVDLYNEAAMPHLAKKFLNVARNSYIQSSCMVPDMVQTAILLGHLDEAIHLLMSLFHKGALDTRTIAFLARLLLAEGRDQEAERILSENRSLFKRMCQVWQLAEASPTSQVSQAS